jgi:hypothetical protein
VPKNLEKLTYEDWLWVCILSIFVGFTGLVIWILVSRAIFELKVYSSLEVMCGVYILATFVGFVLLVKCALIMLTWFLKENPTIAEFAQSNPALYKKLAVLHREELKPCCIQCGSEMRVTTRFSVLSYDPETGYPNKKKMEVFCTNKTDIGDRHKWYSIILDGNDNPV